jgi:hypothetical protein
LALSIRYVFLVIIKTGIYYLSQFSETIRDNEEFLTSIIPLCASTVYTAASTRLQASRLFAFKCLSTNGRVYSSLTEEFRADKEILLFAASGCGK